MHRVSFDRYVPSWWRLWLHGKHRNMGVVLGHHKLGVRLPLILDLDSVVDSFSIAPGPDPALLTNDGQRCPKPLVVAQSSLSAVWLNSKSLPPRIEIEVHIPQNKPSCQQMLLPLHRLSPVVCCSNNLGFDSKHMV